KLMKKLLCEKVFGSLNTSSSSDIISRDYNDDKKWLDEVTNCIGNTQDMIDELNICSRKIRLVTIDFAGLCTNPDFLRRFFKANKIVVELVVDLGHKVDMINHRQLFKEVDTVSVFNC
ncbi:uncharacterized protein EV154DRAFT_385875, partial [Mucor mucedo]|uniref:uncharacterized protein n=1 Tax=Mucor mucedo TaxID=29922 RepID=UPI00221EFB6D